MQRFALNEALEVYGSVLGFSAGVSSGYCTQIPRHLGGDGGIRCAMLTSRRLTLEQRQAGGIWTQPCPQPVITGRFM